MTDPLWTVFFAIIRMFPGHWLYGWPHSWL